MPGYRVGRWKNPARIGTMANMRLLGSTIVLALGAGSSLDDSLTATMTGVLLPAPRP